MKALAYLVVAGGLVAAACSPVTPKGDADAGGADANTTDGGGGEPDAGPGMVTARALDIEGMPLEGVNVVFSRPDGALISMATTPASGEVSAMVPLDAMVSFGYSTVQAKASIGSYLVQIIMGVQPGDTVEVNMFDPFGRPSDFLGTANLMFPTLHAGTSFYTIGTQCNSTSVSGTTVSFTLDFYTNNCSGQTTTMDLLGISWNSNNAPLAWTMFDDVTAGAANTFSSSGWNTNFAQFNAFYTNAPYEGDVDLRVGLLRDGIDYGFGGFNSTFAVTSGGNAAYVVPVPAAFTQVLQVRGELKNMADDQLILHQTNLMPSTTSNSVDLSGLGYPGVTQVTLDTAMPGRPAYRWMLDAAIPAQAQAVLAFTLWGDVNGQWAVAVLAPKNAMSPLRMPELPNTFLADPGTLSPRWPPPVATAPFQNVVGVIEMGGFADYAALRTRRALTSLFNDGSFLSATAPIGSRSIISAGGLISN